METQFVPNGRRYLVLLDEQGAQTIEHHGMKLTTEPEKHNKPTKGTVIATGDGYDPEAGCYVSPKYQVGARLVFGKFAGVDYKNHKDQDCVILAEAEILGEEVPLPLSEVPTGGNKYDTSVLTAEQLEAGPPIIRDYPF